MVDKVRFAFTEMNQELGAFSALPYLPLTLTYQNRSLQVSGLLDTSELPTYEIMQLTQSSGSFDFLKDEPDL